MKFKVDENLPAELVNDLRSAGHDAATVHDEGLSGAADAVVLARVRAEGRAILTLDKGIADVRAYPQALYAGLIVFRPRITGRLAILALARRHLPTLLQCNLAGHLFIVTETAIRVR